MVFIERVSMLFFFLIPEPWRGDRKPHSELDKNHHIIRQGILFITSARYEYTLVFLQLMRMLGGHSMAFWEHYDQPSLFFYWEGGGGSGS
jgi:hypothetical protein